ncbi:Solute carrier family 10 member 6 [Bienertia sinuspersici]
MTSLVESTKAKKRKGRSNARREDDEYDELEDEECERESQVVISKKVCMI